MIVPLLRNYSRQTLILESANTEFSELRRLAAKAVEAGSNDVLVLQRYARLRAFDKDFEAAPAQLLDCEAKLEESGYPQVVAVLNSFYICSLARETQDESLMEAHFPRFVDRFSQWVQEETKAEENVRYVFDLAYSMTGDFLTAERKAAILEALARRDQIDPWFMDVFTGSVEIDIVWIFRTSMTASQVSSGGWQEFAEHLQIANERLRRAWERRPDHPEAAATMITIAMAGHDADSPRAWFERAAAYFTGRMRLLRNLRDFYGGEWVDLSFDESLSGWRSIAGDWTWEAESSVIVSQDTLQDAQYYVPFALRARQTFPPPYVINVDVEELGGSTMTGVGVTIGDVSFDSAQVATGRFCFAHMRAVGVDRGVPDQATALSHSSAGMNWSSPKYHMDIRVWRKSLLPINREGPVRYGDRCGLRSRAALWFRRTVAGSGFARAILQPADQKVAVRAGIGAYRKRTTGRRGNQDGGV